jgi:hypothetical protein
VRGFAVAGAPIVANTCLVIAWNVNWDTVAPELARATPAAATTFVVLLVMFALWLTFMAYLFLAHSA